MRSTKILVIAVVLGALSTACAADSTTTVDQEADSELETTPADVNTGVGSESDSDAPCEGGAFPDDEEFRQLICNMQAAQLDLLRAGGEIDPSWATRSAEAILLYIGDRAGAVAAIEALIAEMGGS